MDHPLKILNTDGKKANFQQFFNVYGRKVNSALGKNCIGIIKKIKLSNRSTFFLIYVKNNKLTKILHRHIYKLSNMPNTKSAIRRVRRVKKQTTVNKIRKSKYKSAVKQMETDIKKR